MGKYFVRFEDPACEVVPVGCVLTMVGTGSEMNAGSVISDPEKKEKRGKAFADARLFPRFAIMDPAYTMTLPRYQMVSGIYDMFNHICEQYFPALMTTPATIWRKGSCDPSFMPAGLPSGTPRITKPGAT